MGYLCRSYAKGMDFKMRKLMGAIMQAKSFAALIFAGLICLYMATGFLCDKLLHQTFEYSIPFIFILQGLLLSALVAVLWGVLLGDKVIKKWRYFPRLIAFAFSLMVLLAACLLTFFALPTDWAKLWLFVAACVSGGLVVLSVSGEIYLRATGKRYTEILKDYQSRQRTD